MDNLDANARAAKIDELRKLWSSEPGRYWGELKRFKLETTEVWPELVIKEAVVLPDLDKDPFGSKKKGK